MTSPYDPKFPSRSSIGVYGGTAGVSGTVVIPNGSEVTGISAVPSASGGTAVIPGITGTITIPPNVPLTVNPQGLMTTGTCTFSGTLAYLVEWTS